MKRKEWFYLLDPNKEIFRVPQFHIWLNKIVLEEQYLVNKTYIHKYLYVETIFIGKSSYRPPSNMFHTHTIENDVLKGEIKYSQNYKEAETKHLLEVDRLFNEINKKWGSKT